MRPHLIGVAKPLRFLAQFPLKAGQAAFPMPPIRLSLAPFFGNEIEGELIGIKLFCCLGDAGPLLLKQAG
jgi:hypothetical protein